MKILDLKCAGSHLVRVPQDFLKSDEEPVQFTPLLGVASTSEFSVETAFAEQVQDQVCTEFEDTDADTDADTDTDTDTCTDTDNKIVVVKLHFPSKCTSSYLPRGS